MPGNQENFQKCMNLGHTAAWDQQWDRASTYYRQALDEMPDNPVALASLGLALFELQDFDAALRVYQRAAVVSPSDPIAFEKVARIYEQKDKVREALQAYRQAADLHLRARDIDKSIDNWLRVLSLEENLTARTRLALIYEKTGRKADAVSEYIASAAILQQGGDLVKAMQMAEYALQLMPESLDAQQTLTLLRTNQRLPTPQRPRRNTGPIQVLDNRQLKAPEKPPLTSLDPIADARQKAMVQLAALLFDQAEEVGPAGQGVRRNISSLTRGTGGLTASEADHTRILMHLGQAIDSLTQNNEAQAAEELERALEKGLRSPAAFYILGTLNSGRDVQKALRYLQQSVKHPDFVLASFLVMGRILQKEGKLAEAMVNYLQALRLCDVQTVPQDMAGELEQVYEPFMEAQSRETDAKVLTSNCDAIANQLIRPGWRQYLQLARQQMPPQPEGIPPIPLAEILLETRNSQVLERLAHIRNLAGMNKLTAAMEEAFSALEDSPSYLPLQIQIGDLLLKEGRTQAAVDKYQLVAELYSLRGEADQAMRIYRRILQASPMDLGVRSRLIDLLVAQGRLEDAVKENLGLAEIYYQLAELNKARQTYQAAFKLSQQARQAKTTGVQILYKLADIDLQRFDWRNALAAYEQIRTLAPDDTNARARLADLHFRMGQDNAALAEVDSLVRYMEVAAKRDVAIKFLEDLVTERPDKMDVRMRLSEQYQQTNQIPKAVEQLDAIADQLVRSGNRAAALNVLQTIISLHPENVAEYERVLEKIKKPQ
jgi:tetratricopeptide (TPR) repeat protein